MSSDTPRKQRSMKACDRCRLKKIKCCGAVPCTRCRQDDAICEYGIRRASDGKSVSAAHVNQLQMHNDLLVKALRITWDRYAKPALGHENEPTPSLHAIVEHSGILDDPSQFNFPNDQSFLQDLRQRTVNEEHGSSAAPQPISQSIEVTSVDDWDVSAPQNLTDNDHLPSFDDISAPITLSSASSSSSNDTTGITTPGSNESLQYNGQFSTGLNRTNRPTKKVMMPRPAYDTIDSQDRGAPMIIPSDDGSTVDLLWPQPMPAMESPRTMLDDSMDWTAMYNG